jgi:hypothetical protein
MLLGACSQNGTSGETRECDQAETLRLAILDHAADAGVAGPCSPKEGGVVLSDFADECAEYEKLAQLCCQKSGKLCY